MLIKPFERGVDYDARIEVPDALYASPKRVELAGYLLTVDHNDRLLISVDDMMEIEGGRVVNEHPVWLPGHLVHYELVNRVDLDTGEIIEPNRTSVIPFGWVRLQMPSWLAACLDQLTAEGLRAARAERQIAEDEAKKKRRAQAASLLRQEKAHRAAREKRRRAEQEMNDRAARAKDVTPAGNLFDRLPVQQRPGLLPRPRRRGGVNGRR